MVTFSCGLNSWGSLLTVKGLNLIWLNAYTKSDVLFLCNNNLVSVFFKFKSKQVVIS